MKTYEASAKTVEEAINQGLEALNVTLSDVKVDILEEGSKGLFGLFGSRLAKVRLTIVEEEEDPLSMAELGIAEEKPAPVEAVKPAAPVAQNESNPARPQPVRREAPKPKAEKPQEKTAEDDAGEQRPARPPRKRNQKKKAPRENAEEQQGEREEQQKAEIPALVKPEITMIEIDTLDPESAAGKAVAFVKDVTRLMGVTVDIQVGTDAEGHVYVQMSGDSLGILIGRRGETLDALQYLTSLQVNRGQETYTRVTLDSENYRAKREDTLVRLANRMANRAVRTGRRVNLEPMNPYERRIIHSALQPNEAVDTHSEGEEPNRHVVITLKK